MSKRKEKTKNVLERRHGFWYENGRRLQRKDYIYHSNHQDGDMLISCITDQLYRLRGNVQ